MFFPFTASPNAQALQAYVLRSVAPLPKRHILEVYGGYSHISTKTLEEVFSNDGFNVQASMRYKIPLCAGTLYYEPYLGADFKRTNNTVLFTEFPIIANIANLTQAILG